MTAAQASSPYEAENTKGLDRLLRAHVLGTAYGLNDQELIEDIKDSNAFRDFIGVRRKNLNKISVQDLSGFRDRLNASGQAQDIKSFINNHLAAQGHLITYGRETVSLPAAQAPVPPTIPAYTESYKPPEEQTFVRQEQPSPQADTETDGWGRAGAKTAKRKRRHGFIWLLLLALIAALVVFGPGLYQSARPWLAGRFPQVALFAAPATATPVPVPTSTPTAIPATAVPKAQATVSVSPVSASPVVVATPAPTAKPNPYDAQVEIGSGLKALAGQPQSAEVVSSDPAFTHKASVTLDGLLDKDTMQALIDLAGQRKVKVSFFPSGMQAAEAPDVVKLIAGAGYPIGDYTLRGTPHLEALSPEAIVEDLASSQKILKVITGEAPSQFKGNATEYTDAVLKAAGAAGISQAIRSGASLTYHSFKSYEEALAWVNRLEPGSIVSVKLSGSLDPSEYTPKEVVEKPAIDLEPGAEASAAPEAPKGTPNERLVQLVSWLLQAIEEADFSPETVALRAENNGQLAVPIQSIRTVQPAVAYAFYGDYSRQAEVQGLLDELAKLNGKGTFFVTEDDLALYPELIRGISQAGHAVEIGYMVARQADYFSASHRLLKTSKAIEGLLSVKPSLVLQPFGATGDGMKEAVSALGLRLVIQDLSFVREDAKALSSAPETIKALYKDNPETFQRGKIVGFRLGFYDSETLLPSLIPALQGTRNAYEILDIKAIADNKDFQYTYPLPAEAILPEIYNAIFPGQLPVTEERLVSHIQTHYIGNPSISTYKQLPGFNTYERSKIDITGRIKATGRTAFLTFDDWGGDVGITKLLAVLKKHNVKATFFVRTEFVPNNPNLLRAIGLEGHEIASHTNSHYPLSIDANKEWSFTDLDEQQAQALQQDVVKSWQVLQSIVGDLRLDNGNPVLSRNFRPPTMAVGRAGLRAIFDLGFDYVVNGYFTAGDYSVASKDVLVRALQRGVRANAVVILHFSDNSIYTADALDEYFTLNANKKDEVFKFARLSDYLQPPKAADTTAADTTTTP